MQRNYLLSAREAPVGATEAFVEAMESLHFLLSFKLPRKLPQESSVEASIATSG